MTDETQKEKGRMKGRQEVVVIIKVETEKSAKKKHLKLREETRRGKKEIWDKNFPVLMNT